MDRTGFVKLTFGDSVSTINYMVEGDYIYGITKASSRKVAAIKNDPKGKLQIKRDVIDVTASIIDDKETVKEFFDKFVNDDNNHYKVLIDGLVVLKFKKI